MTKGKVDGHEAGEAAKGYITWALVFSQYFGFYPTCAEKPLEDFEG